MVWNVEGRRRKGAVDGCSEKNHGQQTPQRRKCCGQKLTEHFVFRITLPTVSQKVLNKNYYYYWVIKYRRLTWAGYVARMEEGRSALKIITGKPTGKRPLGRHRQYQNGS